MPIRGELKPPALHIEPKAASSELAIISSPLADKMEGSKIQLIEISGLEFNEPLIEIIESSPIALLNTNIDQLNILPSSLCAISQLAPIAFTQMAPCIPCKTWSMYAEAGAGMGESYLTSQIGYLLD
ncbi:MAG: hypothetical protein QNK75_01800 [Crocinitomicaceae bacterium]